VRIRIVQAARVKERMAAELGEAAADPDHLPLHEPRLCRGAALAYGLDEPPDRAWLERRSQAWRPYRTWVVLLLRVLLEAETGEIGGTRDVGGRPGP
jgi:DNA-3-methyladenine glycosylase II